MVGWGVCDSFCSVVLLDIGGTRTDEKSLLFGFVYLAEFFHAMRSLLRLQCFLVSESKCLEGPDVLRVLYPSINVRYTSHLLLV